MDCVCTATVYKTFLFYDYWQFLRFFKELNFIEKKVCLFWYSWLDDSTKSIIHTINSSKCIMKCLSQSCFFVLTYLFSSNIKSVMKFQLIKLFFIMSFRRRSLLWSANQTILQIWSLAQGSKRLSGHGSRQCIGTMESCPGFWNNCLYCQSLQTRGKNL